MNIEQEALLTAYALGELEGPEKAAVEAELAISPEKQAWVQEVQELASLLTNNLQQESPLSLTPQQHTQLENQLAPDTAEIQTEGSAITQAAPAAATLVSSSAGPAIAEPTLDEPSDPQQTTLNNEEASAIQGAGWAKWLGWSSVLALLLVGGANSYWSMNDKGAPSAIPETQRLHLPQPSYSPRRLAFPNPQLAQSNNTPLSITTKPPGADVTSSQTEFHNAQGRTLADPATVKLDESQKSIDMNALDRRTKNQIDLTARLKKEEKPADGNKVTGTFSGKDGKMGKGGKKGLSQTKKSQVWQRSHRNTILSRVSVGGKHYLVLKKMRVTVQVDGLRARTVIDHIYYNPHGRTLQGTFKYTLPPRSSVSYYAMFVGQQRRTPRFFGGKIPQRELLRMAPSKMARKAQHQSWGRLREARLVPAVKARQVYEEITRRRIDPALLEQDAPNTFTGRVFPIPAKGYNRVIIAYEQTLPQLGDELVYRFRFPQQVAESIDFSIEYDKTLSTLSRSNLRKIRCKAPQSKAFMRCYWEQNKPDRDAVMYFQPKQKALSWVAGSDPVDLRKYLAGRMRVSLPAATSRFGADHALFALDTSLSANPDLFAAQAQLLMSILNRNQKQISHFNVLLFDTGTRWLDAQKWLPNTQEQRQKLRQKLQTIVLEGATNIDAALKALAQPGWSIKRGTPVDIFVLSDGHANWGNTQLQTSLGSFRKAHRYGQVRFFAYQMGIGAENATFAMQLAREGGAYFSCLGRAEIPRCAVAHTRPSMLLEELQIKGIGTSEILVEGRQVSLYPGGMLAFAARYLRDGKATIVLKGQYRGKPLTIRQSFVVKDRSELAPRAWAELAVAQLSELNSPQLTPLIVAYAQHFRIPNVHCSFLVLETDKEYKQYGLEKQRKQRRVKDVAAWIAQWHKRHGIARDARTEWHEIFYKAAKRAGILRQSAGRMIFSILRRVPDSDFVFASSPHLREWDKERVNPTYLQQRLQDSNQFDPFVDEAKRRLKEDVAGAVRALSCIVELHPSNPQAMRLVGYYLMAWEQPAEAAQLFFRVLQRRPFEPHAYRDLARALVKLDRYPLAAALYEIILARKWHTRFGKINTIASEEYALLLQQANRTQDLKPSLRSLLRQRKALLGLRVKPSKLRVTVTWNTDSTDIDLWVTEPNGERCYYSKRRTTYGGNLLQDITRGYGPERYENVGGKDGYYKIQLHYFGHSTNTLGNETHASILIVLNAGTKQQRVIERNVVLKRRHQTTTIEELKL